MNAAIDLKPIVSEQSKVYLILKTTKMVKFEYLDPK